MELQKVVSSNLSAVGYDTDTNELVVEFNSGMSYKYIDVPFDTYKELMAADSLGTYFNANIRKGGFEYVKLN